MSDARIAAVVVVEKEPVFTLLMMTLFRSSRLHLQGQRMSHWYGKTCCGENIVMTITVHNGTRDKNNSLLPHRCSWASWELPRWADLWLERELLLDVFKHRWGYICETLGGGGVEGQKKKAIIWLHLFKDPSFQKQATADDEQWNAE